MLSTSHKIFFKDSRKLSFIGDESIDLVVTSPPYPMIEMWDDTFSKINSEVASALSKYDGNAAFELMHKELDKTWFELFRILRNGGIACINIGDATRKIGKKFQLYSNHSRIISCFKKAGFDTLPFILWRKQTNAPNKFMGSGMLPAGAYVTLEHEYILVFRKGGKREFGKLEDKTYRMQSAFFWEERNRWFSDVWDFKGVSQRLNHSDLRTRSAAFPFELAYRLINMYSLQEDTVLDPFVGTGTTTLASAALARNSIGVELDQSFWPFIVDQVKSSAAFFNNLVVSRISEHNDFVKEYLASKGPLKYTNSNHGFPVMTRQETGILFYLISSIIEEPDFKFTVSYKPVGETSSDSDISKIKADLLSSDTQQLSLYL